MSQEKDDSLIKGTCIENIDNTLNELSRFKDFLYRNFYKNEDFKDQKLDSIQQARLFRTDKTHHFGNQTDSTVANLKFKPIINQTGKFTYNAAIVTLGYLRHLCKNQCSIDDTQKFPNMLSSISPLVMT